MTTLSSSPRQLFVFRLKPIHIHSLGKTGPCMKNRFISWTLLFCLFGLHHSVSGAVNARLLRQPDVSRTHVTFVYAGDIWVVPKTGGTAQRLSSPPGEESSPRFSPDGTKIAFTA